MDYSSLFSSGLQAMATRSLQGPSSTDMSPGWSKQAAFPDSHIRSHERRPSLPLSTQRRMGLPPRQDTSNHAETEKFPRRRRSNSMISPTSLSVNVGNTRSAGEDPVASVGGLHDPKRKSISTSDIPSFMDDLDSPSLPSSNHRRHFFDPRQNHLSDSFLSFDSPMHSHGRSPTSQTPRSRRSSSSSTHSVSSSTHSVSSFHTESTARELADSLNPEDSDTLRLEDCFDDCSDWRQTIDDLLVDNAALLVMLAGPSGDEEDLFI